MKWNFKCMIALIINISALFVDQSYAICLTGKPCFAPIISQDENKVVVSVPSEGTHIIQRGAGLRNSRVGDLLPVAIDGKNNAMVVRGR